MRYFVTFAGGTEIPVDVTHLPTGGVHVEVDGRVIDADSIELQNDVTNTRIDGRVFDLWMEGKPPDVGVILGAARFFAKVESSHMRSASAALGVRRGGEGLVVSPMPGRVLKVLVNEGDEVVAGSPLIVVEAMKMENELSSGRDGKVIKIFVSAGNNVESGAKLVEIA